MRKLIPVGIVTASLLFLFMCTTQITVDADMAQNLEIIKFEYWDDAYEAIETTIANKDTSVIIVADISNDEIVEVFKAVTIDHPEFMTIKKEFSIFALGNFKRISFSYAKFDEQKALNIAETFVSRMGNLSDVEKVAFVYSALTNHVEYSADKFEYSTAYGPLVNLKGTCEGYSEAMSLILTMSGVENRLVSGAVDGVPHRWVKVNINGTWYEFDPTFDAGKDNWEYFMVNKAH